MPRILINATPCGVGGGVQVSLGFIREALACSARRGWTLRLAVSPAVAKALGDVPAKAGVAMDVFEAGPGLALRGRSTRRRLREICREWEADAVFTVFGPSYVRFGVPEFMGFAEPFAICPAKGCYRNYAPKARCVAWLKSNFKRIALHTARAYWVETETARRGLSRRALVPASRIDVVPNGVNAAFAAALTGAAEADSRDILLMGAAYPHKNHAIILPLVRELDRLLPSPWRFVVTLPDDSSAWRQLEAGMASAGLSHRVRNLGVLDLASCAAAYERATVIFHPSLLEVFSATYVEAMAAKRPLLVSDRAFAREVCAGAAIYFDPLDPADAALKLKLILDDPDVRRRLISEGYKRLRHFPDAAAKNGRLCDLMDVFMAKHVAGKKTPNPSFHVQR